MKNDIKNIWIRETLHCEFHNDWYRILSNKTIDKRRVYIIRNRHLVNKGHKK